MAAGDGQGTGGSGGPGAVDRLSGAVDELRRAAEQASGDVRSRIESAMDQIREASSAAASRAQERGGELGAQLDTFREWVQGATVDLLDEIQKEVDRRRQQLTGGGSGGSSGGGPGTSSGGA